MASLDSKVSKGKNKTGKGGGGGGGGGGGFTYVSTIAGRKNDSDLVRNQLKSVIRDANISKYMKNVESKQSAGHDYYLRARPPSGKLEVDHTFECQLLAASIINVETCHPILAQMDLSASRTNQPIVVRNFISPIFEVHNDHDSCINLKLVDKIFNIQKGHAVTNWLKEMKKSGGGASNEQSIGRALEDMFSKNKETSKDYYDGLVGKYEQELVNVQDPYCRALKEASPSESSVETKAGRAARELLDEVELQVENMFEALQVSKSR
jgi:hypothetical protein